MNERKMKPIYTGEYNMAPYYDPYDTHVCIKIRGILKDPQDPHDPYYKIYEKTHKPENDINIKEYCKICHKIMNNIVISKTYITKIEDIERIKM